MKEVFYSFFTQANKNKIKLYAWISSPNNREKILFKEWLIATKFSLMNYSYVNS